MKSYSPKQVILSTLFSALIIFNFSSCNEEDVDSTSGNYYVMYVIKGNGTYGRFSNWTVSTPQGKYTNSGTQVRSWTQTYGPINNVFKCGVQIGNYIDGAPTIEIYVSKNQEPFALKVTTMGNSASYTLDF